MMTESERKELAAKLVANKFVIDALKLETYNLDHPAVYQNGISISYNAFVGEDRDIQLHIFGIGNFRIKIEKI